MARPRKPTELKLLQGTAQKCRMNPDEPPKSSDRPKPPEYLTDMERDHFEVIVGRMSERGYASASYTEIIALASQVYPHTLDPDQLLKAAPVYKSCLSELGLTPSSSSKVVVKKQEEKANRWAM